MEQRGEDGHLRAVVVVQDGDLIQRAAAVVIHRLGYAPVIHADADAAREEHGEPGDVPELGALVLAPQLQAAVLGERQVQQEKRPDVLRADVQPGEVLGHPALPLRRLRERVVGRDERGDGEAPQHGDRERRHDPVQADQATSKKVHREPARGAHEPEQLSLVREVRHRILVATANIVEDHGGRCRSTDWAEPGGPAKTRSSLRAARTERADCFPFVSRLAERRAGLVRQPRAGRCGHARRVSEKDPNSMLLLAVLSDCSTFENPDFSRPWLVRVQRFLDSLLTGFPDTGNKSDRLVRGGGGRASARFPKSEIIVCLTDCHGLTWIRVSIGKMTACRTGDW